MFSDKRHGHVNETTVETGITSNREVRHGLFSNLTQKIAPSPTASRTPAMSNDPSVATQLGEMPRFTATVNKIYANKVSKKEGGRMARIL